MMLHYLRLQTPGAKPQGTSLALRRKTQAGHLTAIERQLTGTVDVMTSSIPNPCELHCAAVKNLRARFVIRCYKQGFKGFSGDSTV